MEGEGERRTPLVTEIISVARGIARAKGRGEVRASPPDSPRDGILFRRERETFAEEERNRRKRRRGERKPEKEREREGREEDFPPPASLAMEAISVARRREEK